MTVDFDDSIIEDTNTTIDRNIKLVQAGLRSKLSAIMEINKCDEATAQKGNGTDCGRWTDTGQDIDWTQDDTGRGDENGDDVNGSVDEPENG